MPNRIVAFFKKAAESFGSTVRYLYFLRFAILLWALPGTLAGLNETGARSLMSGIVTPVRTVQYLCVTFFLVSTGFVSLVLARIVLLHGQERFGNAPPLWLSRFLTVEPKESWWLPQHRGWAESISLLASQLWTFVLIGYFFYNGHFRSKSEGVNPWQIAEGVIGGLLLSLAFWYVVSAFYFLTYRKANKMPARPLVFPRKFLLAGESAKVLENARIQPVLAPIADFMTGLERFIPTAGYKCQKEKPDYLYEGHFFAIIAFIGFMALYVALCPLTAPIPTPHWAQVGLLLYLLGQGVYLMSVLAAREATHNDKASLLRWKFLLSFFILIFAASIPALYYFDDAERFPILALILILAIFLGWVFGALAFFLDRFRVPVLLLFLVVAIVPRVWNLDNGQEEHYLSIALRSDQVKLMTPGDILKAKLQPAVANPQAGNSTGPIPAQTSAQTAPQTLIVVTSTGGGIHAAAWTASVLRELEKRFEADPKLGSFHQHVLLLSTVSGGSSGLYTYLRELDPKTNGGKANWDRMNIEAECSSLEAVGWGLVYYDTLKAIVPLIPYFIHPSSGVNDLGSHPMFKDRTWALRSAFARNLNDPYCQDVNGQSGDEGYRFISLQRVENDNKQTRPIEKELTVGNFPQPDATFPAFVMNTTTVEEGRRFLSANYYVPADDAGRLKPPPAESFLQIYGRVKFTDGAGKQMTTDLPLATAAQMSATFPYVSSAATFPHVMHRRGVHFVDGGYYDNDGTASAIEFLSSAIDHAGDALKGRLRVILVEIRNDKDDTPGTPGAETWRDLNAERPPAPKDRPPGTRRRTPLWNLDDQLRAPLDTFWGAGHESVTSRNRRTLELLEMAYKDRLDLQQIVIDDRAMAAPDPDDRPPTDPLNWSLTPAQQLEIDWSATKDECTLAKYAQIVACFQSGGDCSAQPPQCGRKKTAAVPQK